jgi:hypothetical protein
MTRCPACRRPLLPDAVKCKCGKLFLRMTLQPKQRLVLDLVLMLGAQVATKIGFGGSRGAAKSRLARDLALYVSMTIPGITVFIIRRNWGDLEENHLEKFKLERPKLTEYYSGSRQSYEFPAVMGGSRIAFKYGDTIDDIRRVGRGPEAYLEIVDQAEQFSEEELAELNTTNRWPAAPTGSAKTLYLFNPGGAGSEYLRRVFYLRQYKGTERPADFEFIQAYGWDNFEWFRNEGIVIDGKALTFDSFYDLPGDVPPCPLGVYDQEWLAGVPDNHRFKIFVTETSEGRKMWAKPESIRMGDLFGRFDSFAGQYFAGVWDERRCVLPTKLVDQFVQYWWTCWMSGDWGYGHHSAIYWFATGKISPSEAFHKLGILALWPLDIVVVYRELVAHRMAEVDLGHAIVSMTPRAEREALQRWVMGSDVKIVDRKSQHSVKELIESVTIEAGLPPIRTAQDQPGSRVINARLAHAMLARTSSMRSENAPQEQDTTPLLFVSSECPQLIGAIPQLICDKDKVDDVQKLETLADDCFDGWKYGCAEYLDVKDQAPREVRRAETMEAAATAASKRHYTEAIDRRAAENQGRYMAMLQFDEEERMGDDRGRRR